MAFNAALLLLVEGFHCEMTFLMSIIGKTASAFFLKTRRKHIAEYLQRTNLRACLIITRVRTLARRGGKRKSLIKIAYPHE